MCRINFIQYTSISHARNYYKIHPLLILEHFLTCGRSFPASEGKGLLAKTSATHIT